MKSAVISRFESPPRPAAALQRTFGKSRISWKSSRGRTVLDRLEQDGAAKIRMPDPEPGDPPLAVLLNTAGGLTGGDRIETAVEVGAGCRATATSQACERIYRSLGPEALVETRLTLGEGARLDWLPQETILFEGGRLSRRLEADLAPDATLLAVEAVIFGRAAMGERVATGFVHDRWRVRRGGKLAYADDLHMDWANAGLLANPATLAGAGAVATILFMADGAQSLIDRVRERIGEAGGASAWNGKLVARIAAPDGQGLRRVLIGALSAILSGISLPKLWQS
jgi:urease accessory protein